MKTHRWLVLVLGSVVLLGSPRWCPAEAPVAPAEKGKQAAHEPPPPSDADGRPQLNAHPSAVQSEVTPLPGPPTNPPPARGLFGLSMAEVAFLIAAVVAFVLLAFLIRWMTTPRTPTTDEPQT